MEKPHAPLQPVEPAPPPPWQGRSIAGPKLRLVEFSAFVEQPQESDVVSSLILQLFLDLLIKFVLLN